MERADRPCVACGQQCGLDDTFCSGCGAALPAGMPAPQTTGRLTGTLSSVGPTTTQSASASFTASPPPTIVPAHPVPPVGPRPTRPRGVWLAAAAGVAVVVAASAVVATRSGAPETSQSPGTTAGSIAPQRTPAADPDPLTGDLAAAVRSSLQGDAKPVSTFRATMQPLLTLGTGPDAKTKCRTTAADLDAKADLAAVANAAAVLPDPILSSLFLTERRRVLELLHECSEGTPADVARTSTALRTVDHLIAKRLGEP